MKILKIQRLIIIAGFISMLILSLVSCEDKQEKVAAEAVEEVPEPKFENNRNLLQRNAEELGLKDSLPKSFDEIQKQIDSSKPITKKITLGKSQLGKKVEIDKKLDTLKYNDKSKEYQEFIDSISQAKNTAK